jgi:hypothetical protein
MTCQGWCGLCYANVRGRASYKHHKGYRSPPSCSRSAPMVFKLEKRSLSPQGDGGVVMGAGVLLAARPALSAMLCDETYADGGARKTATLLLFTDGGAFKACLRDRDADETAWVSGEGLEGILDALEAGLQGGRLDWRKEGKRKRR